MPRHAPRRLPSPRSCNAAALPAQNPRDCAVLVAMLARLTLAGYFELGIALVVLGLLLVLRLRRIFMWGGVAVSVVTALLVARGAHDYSAGVRVMERDFYGVVRTADHDS